MADANRHLASCRTVSTAILLPPTSKPDGAVSKMHVVSVTSKEVAPEPERFCSDLCQRVRSGRFRPERHTR